MKEQIIQTQREIYERRVNITDSSLESPDVLIKNIIRIYSLDTKKLEYFIYNTSELPVTEVFEFNKKNKLMRRYGK